MRVGRGAVHVVRSSDPGAPFGRTTVRFFTEGDRHQAAGWTDVVLPPDDEPEPSVKAGSFDRVPRQTGALVGLVIFGVVLLAGVGFGVRAMFRTGWRVSNSATEFSKVPAPTPPAPAPTVTPLPATSPPTPAEPPAPAPAPALAAPADKPADEEGATGASNEPPPAARQRPGTATTTDARARASAGDGDDGDKQGKPGMRTKRSRHGRAYLPPADQALDQQTNPATTGDVVPPRPMDEPSIAPPPAVPPPPEKAAPAPPADPFEP